MTARTISVPDFGGASVTVATLPDPGRAAALASLPTAFSTEDLAAVNAITAAIAAATPAGSNLIGAVVGPAPTTLTVTVTRPANTTAYDPNDAYSNSTSAPTVITFTGAARASGKSVILSDVFVTSSNPVATALQCEVWFFDTTVTAINDNAAFAISDTEVQTQVERLSVALFATANNACGGATSGKVLTTVGSANLFALVRVTNAYTPISGEVLTIRAKFIPVD